MPDFELMIIFALTGNFVLKILFYSNSLWILSVDIQTLSEKKTFENGTFF